jgi:hypothetical protein
VLCEEVLAPGGGFLVGSGLSDQSVFVLKLVVRALFQYAAIDPHLTKEHADLFHFALAISDRTLRAAGLSRGMARGGAPQQSVSAPDGGNSLLAAVEISPAEQSELPVSLAPLIRDLGEVVGEEISPAQPFVAANERLIVAYPFEVAATLRHFAATEIVRRGFESEFSLRLSVAAASVLDASLRRLGMTSLGPPEDLLPETPFPELSGGEALYRFDDDKVAHAMLIVDDLSGYDCNQLYQFWNCRDLEASAHDRAREVRDHLLRRSDVGAVHSLFVVVPLDRGMQFAVPESLHATFLPLYDLESFAQSAANDPLALWKLAQATSELAALGELFSFSPLDVHQFLRESDYEIPTAEQPTLIVARPGGGGVLREEQARRLDPHPVPHPSGSGIEVERWLPHAPGVPIYLPRESPWSDFECLVEGDGLFVWVVGPNSDPGRAIGHTIAYWLWQALPDITDRLEGLADDKGTLLVRFDLERASRWEEDDHLLPRKPARRSEPFACIQTSAGTETFVLTETARSWLRSADNAGERELLRHVLAYLLGESRFVDEIVDRRVPPGYKKQLIFSSGPDPRLSMRGLPREFRAVQPYDRARTRSALSRRLSERYPQAFGPTVEDEAQELLHAYVGFAFEELQLRLRTFAPHPLIERLILLNERLVQEQAQLRTTALTNRLAYGDVDESLADRDLTEARLAEASVATRFLIELAASSPHREARRFSLADVDELLALAVELIQAGRTSDAIRHGLGNPEVALHENGLSMSPGEAVSASLANFIAERLESEIAGGEATLRELIWEPPAELVELPPELDEAFAQEVGIPFSEIGVFLSALIDYGIDTESGVVNAPLTAIRSVLREAGFTDSNQIAIALERFSLAPRDDFLAPPAPAGLSDVYPWRMNRALSFLRRPLVHHGDRVLYGVRHLYNAQTHLARQIEGGRFPARTAKLRKLQGKYGRLIGRSFEDAVSELFERYHYPHRVRVRQLQGRPLANEGRNLGDIDVLVADESRRRLIAVDAKCLGAKLNADDMLRQSEQLLGTRRSAASRTSARADWLASNRDAAAAEFGNPDIDKWTVMALIVTDCVLPAAYFTASAVPILSYGLLKRQLSERRLLPRHRLQE